MLGCDRPMTNPVDDDDNPLHEVIDLLVAQNSLLRPRRPTVAHQGAMLPNIPQQRYDALEVEGNEDNSLSAGMVT